MAPRSAAAPPSHRQTAINLASSFDKQQHGRVVEESDLSVSDLHDYRYEAEAEIDYLVGLQQDFCCCDDKAHFECVDCGHFFCHTCAVGAHKSSEFQQHVMRQCLLQSQRSEYEASVMEIERTRCKGMQLHWFFPEPFETNYPWGMHTAARLGFDVTSGGDSHNTRLRDWY